MRRRSSDTPKPIPGKNLPEKEFANATIYIVIDQDFNILYNSFSRLPLIYNVGGRVYGKFFDHGIRVLVYKLQ